MKDKFKQPGHIRFSKKAHKRTQKQKYIKIKHTGWDPPLKYKVTRKEKPQIQQKRAINKLNYFNSSDKYSPNRTKCNPKTKLQIGIIKRNLKWVLQRLLRKSFTEESPIGGSGRIRVGSWRENERDWIRKDYR